VNKLWRRKNASAMSTKLLAPIVTGDISNLVNGVEIQVLQFIRQILKNAHATRELTGLVAIVASQYVIIVEDIMKKNRVIFELNGMPENCQQCEVYPCGNHNLLYPTRPDDCPLKEMPTREEAEVILNRYIVLIHGDEAWKALDELGIKE
jgi:hypothetical protein